VLLGLLVPPVLPSPVQDQLVQSAQLEKQGPLVRLAYKGPQELQARGVLGDRQGLVGLVGQVVQQVRLVSQVRQAQQVQERVFQDLQATLVPQVQPEHLEEVEMREHRVLRDLRDRLLPAFPVQ